MRTAAISRNTKETQVKVRLNLDGTGRCAVNTGIGFFDHMLEQIARQCPLPYSGRKVIGINL